MGYETTCSQCGAASPILETNCPHCYSPFPDTPNVRIAQVTAQQEALERRYQEAVQFASENGLESSRKAFENAIELRSHAVGTLSYTELRCLVENERHVFSTYYKLVEGGLRIPSGSKWDVLRGITEHALYQHQKGNIRFAALSLDHIGVKNYGECHVTFKEHMIKNRTSTFEDNNVVFMAYTRKSTIKDAVDLLEGYTSDWNHRHKLTIAKLARKLPQKTPDNVESAAILIDQGKTTADDRFIELHIWGPMTVRTIDKLIIIPKKSGRRKQPKKAEIESLRAILKDYSVDVSEN